MFSHCHVLVLCWVRTITLTLGGDLVPLPVVCRLVRRQWDVEMRADRSLMRSIIKTWKQLRALRQLQNGNNTSVKLVITK